MDASIFDSVLSHTRRSDASQKKEEKIACPLLDSPVSVKIETIRASDETRSNRIFEHFFTMAKFQDMTHIYDRTMNLKLKLDLRLKLAIFWKILTVKCSLEK